MFGNGQINLLLIGSFFKMSLLMRTGIRFGNLDWCLITRIQADLADFFIKMGSFFRNALSKIKRYQEHWSVPDSVNESVT